MAVTKNVRIDLARLKLNIGKIYLKVDYKAAEPYINDAYSILEKDLGIEQYDTLNALTHKAEFLRKDGRIKDAEKIFGDVLSKIDGKKERDALLLKASTAHALGNLYSDTEPKKAMPYFETAEKIFTEILSPTNPDTIDVMNSICSIKLSLRIDVEKALHDLSYLLPLYIKIYGQNDPNTAVICVNIGLGYYYLGQFKEAINYYEKALEIYHAIKMKSMPMSTAISELPILRTISQKRQSQIISKQ